MKQRTYQARQHNDDQRRNENHLTHARRWFDVQPAFIRTRACQLQTVVMKTTGQHFNNVHIEHFSLTNNTRHKRYQFSSDEVTSFRNTIVCVCVCLCVCVYVPLPLRRLQGSIYTHTVLLSMLLSSSEPYHTTNRIIDVVYLLWRNIYI